MVSYWIMPHKLCVISAGLKQKLSEFQINPLNLSLSSNYSPRFRYRSEYTFELPIPFGLQPSPSLRWF
jgi:hypothetical protein